MQYTTTVTQKGQITLPKTLRDALNISPFDQVVLSLDRHAIKVESTQDILDLAGSLSVVKKPAKSVLAARDAFDKTYKRF